MWFEWERVFHSEASRNSHCDLNHFFSSSANVNYVSKSFWRLEQVSPPSTAASRKHSVPMGALRKRSSLKRICMHTHTRAHTHSQRLLALRTGVSQREVHCAELVGAETQILKVSSRPYRHPPGSCWAAGNLGGREGRGWFWRGGWGQPHGKQCRHPP